MSSPATYNQSSVMARLIDPDWDTLSPDVARFILGFSFPESDIARMNELSAKARAGTLSDEEQRELDDYLHVGDVVAIWQSKARQALKRSNSAP